MKEKVEIQADKIRDVLSSYGVLATVTGGTSAPRWAKFRVSPLPGTMADEIMELAVEIAAVLDVPTVEVSRRGVLVTIKVLNSEQMNVDTLLDSMNYYKCPHTAALGVVESGAPLLINLDSAAGAHVLITGEERDGPLSLMVASLIRWNEPSALRVADANGQLEVLARGVTDGREKRVPLAVALVDGDLTGSPAALHTILESGPGVGLHVLMTASHVNDDLRALFPTQIVGKGDGCFHCIAPGFQGTFQAPVSAKITQ